MHVGDVGVELGNESCREKNEYKLLVIRNGLNACSCGCPSKLTDAK